MFPDSLATKDEIVLSGAATLLDQRDDQLGQRDEQLGQRSSRLDSVVKELDDTRTCDYCSERLVDTESGNGYLSLRQAIDLFRGNVRNTF